jgi:hypothetical protein
MVLVLSDRQLIEGIGNEVVVFTTTFIAISITTLFIFVKRHEIYL